MVDFPNLDDFFVNEYGDIHMADPRVVNVLQVAGKDHIEYCYENDEMLCSIDLNPSDGKWRWMIIQRRPYTYMDDGNLGGTDDLLTAYAEAKAAYLHHRQSMDGLMERIRRTGSATGETVPPDSVGHPAAPTYAPAAFPAHTAQAKRHAGRALDEIEDELDFFFAQAEDEGTITPEHSNLDIGSPSPFGEGYQRMGSMAPLYDDGLMSNAEWERENDPLSQFVDASLDRWPDEAWGGMK